MLKYIILLGSAIASPLSWASEHSFPWLILHTTLSWVYVIWYGLMHHTATKLAIMAMFK